MSEYRPLDGTADVLPVGLQPTPFGDVWQALQQVAAQVWNVDPSVYRAGIAWLWYALRNPAALDADGLRPLLVAALISEQAPLVKDTQTAAELAEYLRLWRDYTPTYPKLEALYRVFAADVEILPITAPGYAPPANTRLAFFVVIRGIDFDRPLTADEAALIAVRVTPMGSHPVVVTELSEGFSLPVYPLRAGVPAISVENAAICEPVTPPTPAYQEITLYMASGNKQAQSGVTSSFTGNVNSTYCYPLYTDVECTTRWNGYDYSNDYELGRYVDGVWTPYIRQSVSGMPASTTGNNDYVFGRILLDTGELWHVTNYQFTGTTSNLNPIIRIYPKAQQHYVRYLSYNNAYNNTTVTTANKSTYPAPMNGSSSNTSGWFQTFPKATITRLLMSAGNEAQSVSGDEIAASTGYRMIFRQASAMSRTFRAIEYTLDRPTLHAWLKTDHTNKSTTAAALNDLYDDDGNLLMFDGDYSVVYVPLGLFVSGGANCSNNQLVLERATFGRRSSGEWCFIQSYAGVSIARVWYVKYTDCKVAYFNANKTNYTWAQGTTRVLYDANGNQIPYDSTKTYTILQLRESSHLVIAPTFGDMALKSLINNVGYLACNAASGGQYSSLSVASVWYLEE